jgi:NADH-quinone oxidoreductase subunit D
VAEIKNYTLNFGPQHPAAHGVLRLVLELDGEVIQRADPHIGLLHRATEKLAETRTFIQSLPYMDRLDYVSMMCNEHAYCLAIEKLMGIEVPERAKYIRVMFSEITRLLNHLLWLGAHGLDCGAMNMLIYCFREREDLFDMYEAVSGARMHAAYFRPGGVYRDLPDTHAAVQGQQDQERQARHQGHEREPPGFAARLHRGLHPAFPELRRRVRDAAHRQPHLEAAHRRHRRGHARARAQPGLHRPHAARLRHRMGPAQEAALRRLRPHGLRHARWARPATATTATWCACTRCAKANRIIKQCVDWLRVNPGPVITDNHKVAPPDRESMKSNMEELIHHFKLFTEGFHVPEGEAYAAVEHPKGEFGIYIVSDGANKPYRLKIRAPGFPHLAALDEMGAAT